MNNKKSLNALIIDMMSEIDRRNYNDSKIAKFITRQQEPNT